MEAQSRRSIAGGKSKSPAKQAAARANLAKARAVRREQLAKRPFVGQTHRNPQGLIHHIPIQWNEA